MSIHRGFASGGRIAFFIIAMFVLTGLMTYRLFNLTYVRHIELERSAKNQYNNPSALLAGRGNIYFSDYSLGGKKNAASNKFSSYLYSNNSIVSSRSAAESIAPILNRDVIELELLLGQKDKSYLVLARNLSKEQADKIKALKLPGLTVASEISRFYNNEMLAAPVLGFVGFDGNQRVGQYGVEFSYDDTLSG